jgi:peroxiredoxin Q/BCP
MLDDAQVSGSGVQLLPGEAAPELSLLNQNGELITSPELFTKNTVLYFFPSAGTPGCTKEAADFQDHVAEFENHGYQIVGVSPDSVERLKSFEDSHELTFTLLSDPDLVAHKAFGAFGDKTIFGRLYRGVLRSTIVIEAGGRVKEAMYNVRATGHIPKLLQLISQ